MTAAAVESGKATASRVDPRRVDRLLLIHFGQLGDSVLALPAARALRERYAQARLVVLASQPAAQIFRLAGFPEVWPVDRAGWKRSPARALVEIPALVARLYTQRFDLSVDLHSFDETNLLAWAAGIPARVAMLRRTRSIPRLITHKPPWDDEDGVLLDRYCAVLEPLGIEVRERHPRLTPPAEAVRAAREKLAAVDSEWHIGEWLGVAPGAGHPSRRWPAGRFVEVIGMLAKECGPRFRAMIFAGPEESEETLAVFRPMKLARIVRGLSVPQLAAALAECRVLLTNATGPSHIAAAVGTRVVTIGEIPAFDPVGHAPGMVHALRAARVVSDVGTAEVLEAVGGMWRGRQ